VELTNISKVKLTHKKQKERVRLTVGCASLNYSREVAASTVDITTFKILINITISTKDAAMMMMDIKKLCGHSFTSL
jgi:hypothetical protein